MPIYEYICKACEIGFEKYQRRIESPKPKCPECGKKRRVERTIAGYSFHKDEATKIREMDPKYAKMFDDVWDKAAKGDPLRGTRMETTTDSGKRLQDMW